MGGYKKNRYGRGDLLWLSTILFRCDITKNEFTVVY